VIPDARPATGTASPPMIALGGTVLRSAWDQGWGRRRFARGRDDENRKPDTKSPPDQRRAPFRLRILALWPGKPRQSS
jgi:hypothetical protein